MPRRRTRQPLREAAAEEERHKEEARLKAETEQAALEELKEENPEAYAKPETDQGTEGADDEAGENAAEES